MDINYFKSKVKKIIDNKKDELIEIEKYIYDNPETCFNEHKAVAKLIEYMEKNEFEIERNLAGLDTAFKAVYRSEKDGLNIGICAEYDALEMGHACGHNLMAGMSVGAVVAIKGVIDEIGGTITLIGTPAEEGGGGKIIILEKGGFDELDAAMILHPASDTVVNDISYSTTTVEVNFYGIESHAATFPYEGISALNALIQVFNIVNGLRHELMERGKILGIITKGGDDPIMMPKHAQGKFAIRSFDAKFQRDLLNRFISICQDVAKITNTKFEYNTVGLTYESIKNNETIESLLEDNFKELGEVVKPRERELGIGCTDMGNVTRKIPALQSYVKVQEGTRGHTKEFLEACGDERGEKALIIGAKAMAMTSIDLLCNGDNVKKMNDDFEEMKKKYI